MADYWDRQNTRSSLSGYNSYHGQMNTFQAPFPEYFASERAPSPPIPEHHGQVNTFNRPLPEDNVASVPYYEGYTIRPDDLVSSEARWSLPAMKSIPATQEDLHTEVIRQRQSGRTACRELEDCHGPKRLYIDRLIRERNAGTSLGYFEVAQLRLERNPRDSAKISERNSGRNCHARDYKQKDPTKSRQKTVYMHIILQFVKSPNRSFDGRQPDDFAPRDPYVGDRRSGTLHTLEEDDYVSPMSSIEPCVLPGTSQRPMLARGYPYTTGNKQAIPPQSSRYISRGTQTTFPARTRPQSDACGVDNTEDPALGDTAADDSGAATIGVEEIMPGKSPSSDEEVVATGDSAAAHQLANGSTEQEGRAADEYEKPTWFQNLQPGQSLHHP